MSRIVNIFPAFRSKYSLVLTQIFDTYNLTRNVPILLSSITQKPNSKMQNNVTETVTVVFKTYNHVITKCLQVVLTAEK